MRLVACVLCVVGLAVTAAEARGEQSWPVWITSPGEVHHIGNNDSVWPSYPVEGLFWETTFYLESLPPVEELRICLYDSEYHDGSYGEMQINGQWISNLPDIPVGVDPPPEPPGPPTYPPEEDDWWTHYSVSLSPGVLQLGENTFWIQGGGGGTDDLLFADVCVPEPGAISLVVLGVMAAWRRRA